MQYVSYWSGILNLYLPKRYFKFNFRLQYLQVNLRHRVVVFFNVLLKQSLGY